VLSLLLGVSLTFKLFLPKAGLSESEDQLRVGRLIYKYLYTMAKKLYVGSLSYTTTEDGLKDFFAGAGTVESAMIILDRMSGRSKGFGFVEMSSDEEAKKAVEMFNGKDLDGRKIVVDEARPMKERPAFGRKPFNSRDEE
jgi:cold-inducible RNA-binding protein